MLLRTEKIILDHIKANRPQRDFWNGKIAEWRAEGKSEDDVALALADNLRLIYNADESAREDLEGLIDFVNLLTADYESVAWAFLGRDFREEAVAAMIPDPPEWPGPYFIVRGDKKFGPFSYAQIRIKWANEEITAEDKAIFAPTGELRPAQHLAEPWTAPGWVAPAQTPTPKPTPKPLHIFPDTAPQFGPRPSIREIVGEKKWKQGQDAVRAGLAEAAENNELRKRLREGDKPKEKSNEAEGCGCMLLLLAGGAILYFLHGSEQRNALIVLVIVGTIGYSWFFKWWDKRRKAKQANELTARERVNRKIEASYKEFQHHNPGKFWPGTSSEAESKAAHRAWWKKEHGFEIEGLE